MIKTLVNLTCDYPDNIFRFIKFISWSEMKNSIYLFIIPMMVSVTVSAQDTTRKTHYGVNLSMASYYSDLAFASPSFQVSRRLGTYTLALCLYSTKKASNTKQPEWQPIVV